MKDFSKATPRPWQSVKYHGSENDYHIFSQPDKSVMYQSVCSAKKIDSALIVTAVNNFDKMKEALEWAVDLVEESHKEFDTLTSRGVENLAKYKQLLESLK